jgi:cytochrome c553
MKSAASWRWALSLLALFVAAGVALQQWRAHQSLQRGQLIYQRGLPSAHLAGDESNLPGLATRCVNCHDANSGAQSAFAPALNAAALTQLHSRRGGPPSRYDQSSLCKLLREGVDPAWVQIPRAMPRYNLSDKDCAALWRYLVSR